MSPSQPIKDQTDRFPENFENDSELKSIIRMVLNAKSVEPPIDFTTNMMSKISNPSLSVAQRLFPFWLLMFKRADPKNWLNVSDRKECSTCFFLVGTFYLIMGLSLISGFYRISGYSSMSHWLLIQPQITLVLSLLLICFGVLMRIKGLIAIKVARLGIIGFIIFSIANGICIQLSPGNPFHVAGLVSFTLCSIGMGVYLSAMIQRYVKKEKSMVINENTS